MASSSGCVAFEMTEWQCRVFDNKVHDPALWVVGTPGVLAVYSAADYKERVNEMVTTRQPIDFFRGHEEVANVFTDAELLALGVHGYLGKLALDNGEKVVASTNYDGIPDELVTYALQLPWQLSRDPTVVNLRRATTLGVPTA